MEEYNRIHLHTNACNPAWLAGGIKGLLLIMLY